MKRMVLAGLAVLLGFGLGAQAIDRDAKMIDTASLNLANQNSVDSIGGSIWGETAIAPPDNDWAVLFGGGYDKISPNHSDGLQDIDAWTIGLGLKYYLLPVTSISGDGTFTHYQQDGREDFKDAKAATVAVKQRLMPTDAPVCPFVQGSFTWRNRSTFSSASSDSFSELLLELDAGLEFKVREDFSFIFQGGAVIADQSKDNSEDLDGIKASFGMQYYWY